MGQLQQQLELYMHGWGVAQWLMAGGAALLMIGLLGAFSAPPRYVKEQALFTATELAFLQALEAAVGQEYRIFGKVRLADIMKPSKRAARRAWWKAFTKVSSKHADFVLVDRRTSEIIAAIEVDDRSHERRDRKDRDRFVDRAFAQAGIPLIRMPARGGRYRSAEIRERVEAALRRA